jgi:hypothetical protein
MVNNVIGVVNYVIAARPSLRNLMIADSGADGCRQGKPVPLAPMAACRLLGQSVIAPDVCGPAPLQSSC